MEKGNFSDVFGEIYTKYGAELESLRKQALIKIILIIIATIAVIYMLVSQLEIIYILGDFFPFVLVGIIALASFLTNKVSKDYALTFKINVIQKMIDSKKHDYTYTPLIGVSATEYNISGYDTSWDKFYSEDGIKGTFNSMIKFNMSQVKTERITRDSKGNRHVETTFLGLYGIITLPTPVKGNIDIVENSKFRKFSNHRINLESAEFEKYYDVMTDDKIWALQVINSNAIKDLIDLRNYFKKTTSIRIIGNKIFFRLYCGDVFEPSKLRKTVRFDFLYKYYRLMDLPRYIYDALISNIADVDENKELKEAIRYEKNPELYKQEQEIKKKEEAAVEEESWFSTK